MKGYFIMEVKTWTILQRISGITAIASIFIIFYWFGYRLNGEFIIKRETLPMDSLLLYLLLFLTVASILFYPFAQLAIQNNGRITKWTFILPVVFIATIAGVTFLVRNFVM
ncbi:hypothetical protein LG329_04510 [Virgibacillus necropolis]|uniref:hypothetical protein n=1 Tax=Virgibacillus necropolis TaxID=163877 RepID=UPI00384B6C07